MLNTASPRFAQPIAARLLTACLAGAALSLSACGPATPAAEVLAETNLRDPLVVGEAAGELIIADVPNPGETPRDGQTRLLALNLETRAFRIIAPGGISDPARIGIGPDAVYVVDAEGLKSIPLAGNAAPTVLLQRRMFREDEPRFAMRLDVQGNTLVTCDESTGELLRVDVEGGSATTHVIARGCYGAAMLNGPHVFYGGPLLADGDTELRRGPSDRYNPALTVSVARALAKSATDENGAFRGVSSIIPGRDHAYVLIGDTMFKQPLNAVQSGAERLMARPDPGPWIGAGVDAVFSVANLTRADALEKNGPYLDETIRVQSRAEGESAYHVVEGTRVSSVYVRVEEGQEVLYYGAGTRHDVASTDPTYETGLIARFPWPTNYAIPE